jgi:hypothetical protein
MDEGLTSAQRKKKKKILLRNVARGLRIGRIICNDLDNRVSPSIKGGEFLV